jgi:hypothetical protein
VPVLKAVVVVSCERHLFPKADRIDRWRWVLCAIAGAMTDEEQIIELIRLLSI